MNELLGQVLSMNVSDMTGSELAILIIFSVIMSASLLSVAKLFIDETVDLLIRIETFVRKRLSS